MALNIKNERVAALAAEVAALAGQTKTEAIRRALEERRDRLARRRQRRPGDLNRFLEREIYPHLPPPVRGKPITKAEREEILGYGPHGV